MSMSQLEEFQHDITYRLLSLESFFYVPVEMIRPRDKKEALLIQTRLDRTLAGLVKKNGKAGVVCLVQMATLEVPEPNVPGPFGDLTCELLIIENPLINMGANGTNLSAETVTLNALNSTHQFMDGRNHVWTVPKRAMVPNLDFPGKIAYTGSVQRQMGMRPLAKVAKPIFTVTGALPAASVQLACSTVGASIYYTADGTFPAAANAAATLYTVPFTQASAATIRAAAYLAGLSGSDIAKQTIE